MVLDNLPYWFFKIAAPFISLYLSVICSASVFCSLQSLCSGRPTVSPVPSAKVEQPQICADYRPISITPVLARIMNNKLLEPYYTLFLPTLIAHACSKTSLLFAILAPTPLHSSTFFTLTEILQTYDYVHVIALNFSKAFDFIRHFALVSNLTNFTLPDYLHNCIVHKLSCRQHQTKVNGRPLACLLCYPSMLV